MISWIFVQDIPRKMAAVFEAVEDLSSAWFDYCQAEPGTAVSKDFFKKVIAVCDAYDDLRTARYDNDPRKYSTLPMAADETPTPAPSA